MASKWVQPIRMLRSFCDVLKIKYCFAMNRSPDETGYILDNTKVMLKNLVVAGPLIVVTCRVSLNCSNICIPTSKYGCSILSIIPFILI